MKNNYSFMQHNFEKILLKISGEALAYNSHKTYSSHFIKQLCDDIYNLHTRKKKIAIVVGGGNIFRGRDKDELHLKQEDADHVGMLATIMNGIVFASFLKQRSMQAVVYSTIPCGGIANLYNANDARNDLENGKIVLCVGGTSIPFFTTDTAAIMRASDLGCDVLFKSTKCKGVFTKDPEKYSDAEFLPSISFEDVLARNLHVMDRTAFEIAQATQIPIIVASLFQENPFTSVLDGMSEFTLIGGRKQAQA